MASRLEERFLREWHRQAPDLLPERERSIPGWEAWAVEKKRLGLSKVWRPYRGDFVWPDARVVVELQGATWTVGAHSTGSGIERDAQKALTAVVDGWVVIPLTRTMLERQGSVWLPMLERVIRERQTRPTSVAS